MMMAAAKGRQTPPGHPSPRGIPRKNKRPPPREQAKRSEVRDQLQELILRGEYPPGSRLGQEDLAERFGVAQGTVREALLELKRHGLVESIHRHGMFVTRLDRNKLLEAFQVREMHEALAARLCCASVTRAQVRELTELAERIYQHRGAAGCREMDPLDRQLHSKLIQLSGNGMLIRLADNYQMLGWWISVDRDAEIVRDEHLAILRAIQDGRPDDVERLVRRHVASARHAAEKLLGTIASG